MSSEVPEGWKTLPLSKVADVRLSNVDKKSVDGEPSVRLCNYMDVYSNEVIDESLDFMDATATPSQIKKFGLRRGDVMITKDSEDPSDIAVPSVVVSNFESPVLCGYHLAMLRPRGIDGEFLAWALRSYDVNQHFVCRAAGSTRFGITSRVIGTAKIPIPPDGEQKKIATILSSVDEAILATQAVIDQTRRVKEGLLQDLLTRGIGHTRFKQTEIGEIPEGWEVVSVSRVARVVAGGTPSRSHASNYGGDVPWVKSGEVNLYEIRETEESITQQALDTSAAKLIPAGSTLVAMYGATAGVVARLAIRAATNQAVAALIPRDRIDADFLFFAAQEGAKRLMRQVQGSGQPNLNGKMVKDLRLALPPLDEQRTISANLEHADLAISTGEENLARLRSLKAGLLQDLLTGNVRVNA